MFTFVYPCKVLHTGLGATKQAADMLENEVQSQMSMRDDAQDKLTNTCKYEFSKSLSVYNKK